MNTVLPPQASVSRRFSNKVLASAFCGVHVPLIGILIYYAIFPGTTSMTRIFFVILVLTLTGTAATLLVLNYMVRPIRKGSLALQQYLSSHAVQPLPTSSNDELGVLFQQVEYLMFVLQKTVSERDRILDLAITSNAGFHQSIKLFVDAREAALAHHDNGLLRAALESAVADARSRLDAAEILLTSFGETRTA